MNENVILRQNILGGMNAYINDLGDEDVWERWITLVPDECTEEDLEFIANDKELFTQACILFGTLVGYYDEF